MNPTRTRTIFVNTRSALLRNTLACGWFLCAVVCQLPGPLFAQSHPGARSPELPTVFTQEQLVWDLPLGDHQYTVPRVDGNDLLIGVNDSAIDHPAVESTGGGILMCLDLQTGARKWQLPIPRYMAGTAPPMHFNHWKCGVCSRPAVDGNRLYLVGPRGDILCVDRLGQSDGNAGPFVDELAYFGLPAGHPYRLTPEDGDIVWQYDMITNLAVIPHDVCGNSPVVCGDFVYACTSNGVDDTHNVVPSPDAPSLIALDKQTGQLAAVDGLNIGRRMFHGQWSSPVVAEFGGQTMILFGGGDGVLYAFKPVSSPSEPGDVKTLELSWQYDCCPADYRQRNGQPIPYARWNKISTEGPSEVIATPVVWNGRIYVTIGQSPVHGPGAGILSCIDGATGQKVWDSREVGRTLSDVVIEDGLLYVADYSGHLHCFDAVRGERLWHHDLLGGVWCATPLVHRGRVYISNDKFRFWILQAGREKRVLAQGRVRSLAITPVVAGDILLLPTQNRLFALRVPGSHVVDSGGTDSSR